MRALAVVLLVAVFVSGCVTVYDETRVERGPVLSSKERELPVGDGGVQAGVDARWPTLTLKFERFQVCRRERVEEVVEERITESYVPSLGPSWALGISATAAGAGLLAFQGAFSDQPNTRYIDSSGHYGPSAQQVATGWGYTLLIVGVPALVSGAIGLAESGETVERKKVEHVASAHDTPCKLAPIDGRAELVPADGETGQTVSAPTLNGKVSFGSGQLARVRSASVQLNGAPVDLGEDDARKLNGFFACNDVLPAASAAELSKMGEDALVAGYNAARACEAVAGEPARKAADAYAEETARRRR